MTTLILLTGTMFMLKSAMHSMNPVKTSIAVLVISSLMFFYMSYSVGLAWISILMMMLFMGGIIMMFMILSSILPNEKSIKTNMMVSVLILIICLEWGSSWPWASESTTMNFKTFLLTGLNFLAMFTIVMFYFAGSMSMLSSEEAPMRSIYCYQI